jgi:RND family efflux transporter MFP subunit
VKMSNNSRMLAAALTAASLGFLGGMDAARTAEMAAPASFVVAASEIDDLKAVYGTIRSKDRVDARVRTPGTVASLKVSEGMHVTAGEVLALVVDDKIALRIRSLDAQMAGLKATEAKAKLDLDRALTLKKQNLVAQANVDQVQSAFDVAANALKSVLAEKAVLQTQGQEGEVKAPGDGTVLSVPVTVGSVVQAGESIATIAANGYLLRLQLPERHALFIKEGDPISIASRGLGLTDQISGTGQIILVHPEITGGLVTADAQASGLGGFFVGERALVWISAGKRQTIVIPQSFITKRNGYDFVRIASPSGQMLDVVVQLGQPVARGVNAPSIEVLSGLVAGDRLVAP